MHAIWTLRTSIRLLLAVAAASVVGSQVVVADDLCGETIVSNLKINHDLTCAGTGLIVGADGIKLDLNGHTITGSGSGIGISVTDRTNVLIVGGTVRSFATGVQVVNSTAVVIRDNQFIDHVDRVDLQAGSIGNLVKENYFQNNRSRGIMLRGDTSANIVKENTFIGNRVGILVNGPVGSTVKENVVSSSSLAGMRIGVLATDNLIAENTITSNPAGIDFIVTATGGAVGNTLRENTLTLNTCGLNGPLTGNTLTENVFQANTADTCP